MKEVGQKAQRMIKDTPKGCYRNARFWIQHRFRQVEKVNDLKRVISCLIKQHELLSDFEKELEQNRVVN